MVILGDDGSSRHGEEEVGASPGDNIVTSGDHDSIMYATPAVGDYILANFYPSGPVACTFSRTFSESFLCWLWLALGSCVSPQNKTSQPANHCRQLIQVLVLNKGKTKKTLRRLICDIYVYSSVMIILG